jgi:hypothetical protein
MKNPVAYRLASLAEYPKKAEVIPLKNEYMDRLNLIGFTYDAGVSIGDFVEKTYFPAIEKRLAKSSVKGYRDSWRCHIKDRMRGRVRDFRTVDGENLMCEIETANKTETGDLAHATSHQDNTVSDVHVRKTHPYFRIHDRGCTL